MRPAGMVLLVVAACKEPVDDAWKYPVCGDDVAQGEEDCDGADGVDACEAMSFDGGVSGCRDDCSGVDIGGCTFTPADVVINEINHESEAFEVYNAGTEPQSLAGWSVVDRPDRDELREAPLSGTIEPGEVLLVFPTAFAVGSDDLLVLRDASGRVRDAHSWEGGADSLCRRPDGGAWSMCAQSLGGLNGP